MQQSELELLKKFRFTLDCHEEKPNIRYEALLDPLKIRSILKDISQKIGAPNQRVSASILTKRMAFYAVIHLYAMTVMKKKLIVRHENLKLIEHDQSSLWLPDFYFGPIDIEQERKDRTIWRDEIIHHIFSETINPVIKILSKEIRISRRILWENISLYIFWLYEDRIKVDDDQDFTYIIHEAPGALFGPYKKNPLTIFYENVGESIRIRKSCCLSYLLKGNGKKMCKTCPLNCKKK